MVAFYMKDGCFLYETWLFFICQMVVKSLMRPCKEP